MATQAQCFYCFECLAASFKNRGAPPLSRVEELWEDFQASQVAEDGEGSLDEAHVESTPGEEASAMEDTEDTDEDDDEDEEEVEEEDDEEGNPDDENEDEQELEEQPADRVSGLLAQPSPRPQLPSISRLQAAPPSSQSSSSSTTPSSLSANSSNSALATPASSTTSIPSAPSPRKRPTYASCLSRTASFPVFVTWNTISRTTGHKSLRGCIGTFDPLPLASGLQTYALTSAFEDTRFSPIPPALLPSLCCNITLLANFETCAHPLDWNLGTHGLKITFVSRGRRYGATYLPDVAVEQGWSKEETLESLMRKSGWDGGGGGAGAGAVARRFLRGGKDRVDAAVGAQKPWEEVATFTTVRYTGWKASATYSEWREWRTWLEQRNGTIFR